MSTLRCHARQMAQLLATTSLTAVLLAGCGERHEAMHAAVHQSIKDAPADTPRSVFHKTSVPRIKAARAAKPDAGDGGSDNLRPPALAKAPANVPESVPGAGPADAPKAGIEKKAARAPVVTPTVAAAPVVMPDAGAKRAADVAPANAPKKVEAAPAAAPKIVTAAPVTAPIVMPAPAPVVIALAPAVQSAGISESRKTAEARREPPAKPVVTLEPAGSGTAPGWTPPVVAADPAASAAVKLAAKPTEITAAPAAPKVNATRNRETREKAEQLMDSGKIVAARLVLREAPNEQDPAMLEALGQTYDPLVLKKYPKVNPTAADASRAAELYVLAISKGRTEAKARLDQLHAHLHRAPQ